MSASPSPAADGLGDRARERAVVCERADENGAVPGALGDPDCAALDLIMKLRDGVVFAASFRDRREQRE